MRQLQRDRPADCRGRQHGQVHAVECAVQAGQGRPHHRQETIQRFREPPPGVGPAIRKTGGCERPTAEEQSLRGSFLRRVPRAAPERPRVLAQQRRA